MNDKLKKFVEEYEKLCKEHGFVLVATPTFIQTNHGTFEISVNISAKEIDVKS